MLQLAERGRISLDAPLPHVLPASVAGRFANAAGTSVRMLLGHRSGIPEWVTPAVIDKITHHPTKVWKIGEILDLAAAQPPDVLARDWLLVLEHQLQPARPDHRAPHRTFVASRGLNHE